MMTSGPYLARSQKLAVQHYALLLMIHKVGNVGISVLIQIRCTEKSVSSIIIPIKRQCVALSVRIHGNHILIKRTASDSFSSII